MGLIITYFSADYTELTGPFYVFQFGYQAWFLWSCVLGLLYVVAVFRTIPQGFAAPAASTTVRPGWLWAFLGVVIINGLSPYLGLKTESSFAMYSNLRTEAGINNHMFMPALRFASFQDDFVEIIATDHPMIKRLSYWHPLGDPTRTPQKKLLAYFELRRLVSETESDFYVDYLRGGERLHFERRDGVVSDAMLALKHPVWKAKLLFFRPVFAANQSYCQH